MLPPGVMKWVVFISFQYVCFWRCVVFRLRGRFIGRGWIGWVEGKGIWLDSCRNIVWLILENDSGSLDKVGTEIG